MKPILSGLVTVIAVIVMAAPTSGAPAVADPLSWPGATRESRPWSYWWWLGSAVDSTNLTRELQRYHDAGWGGVHIIPIYGAKGWEDRAIEYLSPQWMAMLRHAVTEGQRLNLGVDMTTGTGWCFGGPTVSDADANALAVARTFDLSAEERLNQKFDRAGTQALMAFAPDGRSVDLTGRIADDGTVDWTAGGGSWRVHAISQRPSGQRVKRAAPGGQGHMLNLLHPEAMPRYLARFTEAFAKYDGPKPRAMYHDSYEYRSDWAPSLFAQFEKRRGYRLQSELPALFGKEEDDRAARVKCDYRETLSDILAEESLPTWARWSREHGFLTRNQAHGAPGNLLDLYAVADIPETEMFHRDRSLLVSKFASSAAHVAGRPRVAAETGTWLAEHFTETLAEVKYLVDDLFLAGVNHVIFHGTCYSPDEAPWPGWIFYASTEMNPRNPIWRDVPALAAYIARCQSVLQSGRPDNDVLVYWPIHDTWQNPKGLAQGFSVHARSWLESQSLGRLADRLWKRGFAFDYVSDRQLAGAKAASGRIGLPGGAYRVVAVPACRTMPLPTLRRLLALAEAGATVVFEEGLPQDVPGWNHLEQRRAELKKVTGALRFSEPAGSNLRRADVGQGRVLIGNIETALAEAKVPREPLADHAGLFCIRRLADDGHWYFVANRGSNAFEGWLTLGTPAQSVAFMDPLSARAGFAAMRAPAGGQAQVFMQLPAGASLVLRTFSEGRDGTPAWTYWQPDGDAVDLTGSWRVEFIQGGPDLPRGFETSRLASWTEQGGDAAQRFGGTARYRLTFDAPPGRAETWSLDLGRVCQSARVRLNGRDLGTLLVPPFAVLVEPLKPQDNVLEVEVTNVAANRIRDLDRRKVNWKNFHDINFVNINYKPFDASNWPLTESGLLGPVKLKPMRKLAPGAR